MLYRKISLFVLRSSQHINTLCGQNAKLLNVKPGRKYSDHCALKGSSQRRLNQQDTAEESQNADQWLL
jgi:hypothetical protein